MICPACRSDALLDFIDLGDVPVNSCLLLDRRSAAIDFPRGRLDLAVCSSCGFITNRSFHAELAEYSARYEETQGYSPTFVAFARELARHWVERHHLAGGHILEIGCGKGEFLTWLLEAGAGSATGIDPGLHPERLDPATAGRIECIVDRYGQHSLDLRADAIVCRHTLEHLPDVAEVMQLITAHAAALQAPLLFELPDTLRVLREVAFWDLYYEHCSYFTAGSLARLFRSSGLGVLDLQRVYGDQYLIIEAQPGVPDSPGLAPIEEEVQEVLDLAAQFRAQYASTLASWQARLGEVVQRGGRVVLWGGGSKAVALLSAPTLQELVDSVVDINPNKHHRFLAGSGHEVLPPSALRGRRPDLVVVLNAMYEAEVAAELAAMGVEAEMATL